MLVGLDCISIRLQICQNNSHTEPLTLNSLFKGRGPSQNSRYNDDSFYSEAKIFPTSKDHVAEGENLNVTSSLFNTKHKKELLKMSGNVREDPVKMHKEAGTLMDEGKYTEAREMFLRTAELYRKSQNYFDATTMYYKAGESSFALKEYEKAIEYFTKSSDLSFDKGYDRFGVSALDYAKDCYKALGNQEKVAELDKKIKETKAKLESAF